MKLVALGDSNTGNNRTPYYVAEGETYFKIIANAMGYDQAINAGVSGNTASAMLARIGTDVLPHAPAVCLVMAGTNEADASITNAIPVDSLVSTYRSAMGGIISALVSASIKPVVISPPYSLKPRMEGRLQAIRAAARNLCMARGVQFVDLFGRMQADSETMGTSLFNQWYMDINGTPDLYHMGVTGHQRIASHFLANQMQVGVVPPASAVGTVLDVALPTIFGNMDAKTIKCRIKAAGLTFPPGQVTKIRLTLQGHADEPLTLAKCYLGKKNAVGDAYDAVSLAPLQVVGASSFTVPAGGQIVTDWLPFIWNKSDDLIVSFYCNGGASSDKLAAASSSVIGDTYLKNADEAATVNATGFTEYLGYLSLVTKIETDGFGEAL